MKFEAKSCLTGSNSAIQVKINGNHIHFYLPRAPNGSGSRHARGIALSKDDARELAYVLWSLAGEEPLP